MTKKELTSIPATDISNWKIEDVKKLNLSTIILTFGKYGMNGGLFKDINTGELYKVTARNSLLFYLA